MEEQRSFWMDRRKSRAGVVVVNGVAEGAALLVTNGSGGSTSGCCATMGSREVREKNRRGR